jgi:hypothetical protein
MILIIIGFLPLFIVEIEFLIEDCQWYNYKNLFDILFLALEHIGLSICEILSKIAFNTSLILPEKLIFDRGVLDLLIHCFIIFPILYFSGQIDIYKNIIQFLWDSSLLTILKILLLIFFIFFRNIITMKVIYLFTPIHTSFLNSIYLYLICMISYYLFDILTPLGMILSLASLMLVIFGALLFCEIIIINKCGFNNHTKYGFLKTVQLGETLNDEPEDKEINEDEDSIENNIIIIN